MAPLGHEAGTASERGEGVRGSGQGRGAPLQDLAGFLIATHYVHLNAAGPLWDLKTWDGLIAQLKFTWCVTKASERLLELGSQFSGSDDSYPWVPWLGKYYREHLTEERGHHHWLTQDLMTAGEFRHQGALEPISAEAALMAGNAYYHIQHVHAASLLGYMLPLECCSMSMERLYELERIHGPQVLRTLRHHVVHDKDHGAELRERINSLPVELHPIVARVADTTSTIMASALKIRHDFTARPRLPMP